MLKIHQNNSQIEKIYKNLQAYLKREKALPQNSNIRILSAKEMTNPKYGGCAGEIEFNKVLPNGNKQKRLVTVYNDGSIGTATAVTAPNGELFKIYYGVRDGARDDIHTQGKELLTANSSTREYDSGLSINILNKTIRKLFSR